MFESTSCFYTYITCIKMSKIWKKNTFKETRKRFANCCEFAMRSMTKVKKTISNIWECTICEIVVYKKSACYFRKQHIFI